MTKSLKILFVIPQLDHGGPDQVFFEILNFLASKTNHNFFLIVTKENGFYLKNLNKNIKVFIEKRPLRIWSRYPIDACFFKTYQLKPDIIITTLRMNLVFNIIYKFLPKKTKLITRIANDVSANSEVLKKNFKSSLGNFFSKYLINNTDLIICQSKYMKKDIKKYIKKKTKVVHIYNPIPTKIIKPKLKYKRDISISPNLISVGRLEYQKGFDILIESFKKVIEIYPEAKLNIYGEGSQRTNLENLIKRLSLSQNIELKGFSYDINSKLENADLFIIASRFEGFSNALLEALFLGIPVITSNCPGANSEIIKKGFNGFLSNNLDKKDLSKKIIKGLRHKWERHQIQKDTQKLFSKEKISKEYLEQFEEILS